MDNNNILEARERSMNYTKKQIDNHLNSFLQIFNDSSKKIKDVIDSDNLSPTSKVTAILVLLKGIENNLDVTTLFNLCANFEFNYGCIYDKEKE